MKAKQIVIILLLVLPLQVVMNTAFGESARYFDIFLLVALYLAFHLERTPLLYLSSFTGLVKDALSGGVLGINGFSFPLITIIAYLVFKRINIRSTFPQFILTFSLTFFNYILNSLLYLIFGVSHLNLSALDLFYNCLANGMLMIIALNLVKILSKKKSVGGIKYVP